MMHAYRTQLSQTRACMLDAGICQTPMLLASGLQASAYENLKLQGMELLLEGIAA